MHDGFCVDIELAGWAQCGEYWLWRRLPEAAQCFNLWYVVQGRGEVCGPKGPTDIRAGDAIVYPPRQLFSATQDPRHRLIVSYTHFQITGDGAVAVEFQRRSTRLLKQPMRDPALMSALLRRSWTAWQSDDDENARTWFRAALLEVYECCREASADGVPPGQKGAIARLAEAIRSQPERRWTAEDMAKKVGVSHSHFNKLFRRATGKSPRAFAIDARIDQARSLLAFSELPIGRIAEMLGYPDSHSFSKQFRARTRLTPSEWRSGKRRMD